MEMGSPYTEMEIASFMSCSKGYMGECGIRGGYAEVVNMDPGVMAMLQKSISAKLCPTVLGQACMDLVVNPPRPGEPSYASWLQQKGELFNIYTSCMKKSVRLAVQIFWRHFNATVPADSARPPSLYDYST